jgi:hypothetical protein
VVDFVLRALLGSLPVYWRHDLCALAVASTLLLYLRAFTDKRRSAEDFHATESVLSRIHYFLGLHGLDFFNSNSFAARLQQLSLYLVLGISVFLALHILYGMRARIWSSAHTWLFITIAFTLVLPFLPDDLSGSKALASRLQIVTFIGFMAAASLPRLGLAWRRVVVFLATASTLGTLALGQARLAPIAGRVAAIDRDPLLSAMPAGSAGLLLSAHATDDASFAAVTYEPMHWQAASYFLRTKTVLLNPPWMDSTWLPLTAKPALLTSRFTPWTLECYRCLRGQMVESASVRGEVLASTDFIVFVDQPGTATRATLADVLDADLPGSQHYAWSCDGHDWYWLCRKEKA